MDEQKDIENKILKVLDGTASVEKSELENQWIHFSKDNGFQFQKLKLIWGERTRDSTLIGHEEQKKKIWKAYAADIRPNKKIPVIPLYRRTWVRAAVKFRLNALPMKAQIAPVYGLQTGDFDGNGHLDVLLAGNNFAAEIHSGWYDAGIGMYLKGNGKGEFKSIHHTASGFFVDTDSKGMVRLFAENGQPLILVSSNDGDLKAFSAPSANSKGLFRPETLDCSVVFKMENGEDKVFELYHGTSYLSHSSRSIPIPDSAVEGVVYNSLGEKRKMDLSSKSLVFQP